MERFLAAFAWTVVVELAVLAAIAPAPLRTRVLFTSLAANLITHPIAFALGPELGWGPCEALVLAAETALFAQAGLGAWPRALLWSLAANAASAAGAWFLPV